MNSTDMMPSNITEASGHYGHYNLMPVYGKYFYQFCCSYFLIVNLCIYQDWTCTACWSTRH